MQNRAYVTGISLNISIYDSPHLSRSLRSLPPHTHLSLPPPYWEVLMGASWNGSARALIFSGISSKCLTICFKSHFINMFVILSRIPCVMWANGLILIPHDIPLGALEDISQRGILSHFPPFSCEGSLGLVCVLV